MLHPYNFRCVVWLRPHSVIDEVAKIFTSFSHIGGKYRRLGTPAILAVCEQRACAQEPQHGQNTVRVKISDEQRDVAKPGWG
jgi:hypothetical protein